MSTNVGPGGLRVDSSPGISWVSSTSSSQTLGSSSLPPPPRSAQFPPPPAPPPALPGLPSRSSCLPPEPMLIPNCPPKPSLDRSIRDDLQPTEFGQNSLAWSLQTWSLLCGGSACPVSTLCTLFLDRLAPVKFPELTLVLSLAHTLINCRRPYPIISSHCSENGGQRQEGGSTRPS
jgi:hypothetical protein